jgi:hypothetical protein
MRFLTDSIVMQTGPSILQVKDDENPNLLEFMVAAMDRKELLSKKNLEATFKMIDQDGNKSLSAQQLKKFFMADPNAEDRTEWDDETWNLLVEEAANSDGLVI